MIETLLRIGGVAQKEVRQLVRDRPTFGMIVGIPLLQILLFGYAINLDVRHLHAGYLDLANTTDSRQVLQAAEASQLVDFTRRAADRAQLEAMIRRGEITIGLVLPADFTARLRNGTRPAGQILIDNSGPSIDNVARQLAELPLAFRQPAAQKTSRFALRVLYNPERYTAVQIVPALIGVILNLTLVLFTAIAIVRERERGNLELLIATPIRTAELMIGKIMPYIVIGLLQTSIILAVGVLLFDVPIAGDLIDLYLAALVFIGASLALGLLISTLAQTQFQAMQVSVFIYLPSILLSGFMFPFEGMPRFAQAIAEWLPLTHFIRLVRGILLRGATLGEMQHEAWILAAFFLAFMVLAVLRFHKRLD